jgi:hypothetical protein
VMAAAINLVITISISMASATSIRGFDFTWIFIG